MKKKDWEFTRLNDIDTFSSDGNETYLCGKNEWGEPIAIVFDTYELLEWLDIDYMKEQLKKHIENK